MSYLVDRLSCMTRKDRIGVDLPGDLAVVAEHFAEDFAEEVALQLRLVEFYQPALGFEIGPLLHDGMGFFEAFNNVEPLVFGGIFDQPSKKQRVGLRLAQGDGVVVFEERRLGFFSHATVLSLKLVDP